MHRSSKHSRAVRLGYIAGVYGVRGWVRVHSFTEPRDNIVNFAEWTLALGGRRWQAEVETGRAHGRGVVAKLAGVDDRDAAQLLIGAEISVDRESLPGCAPGEYYWTDLEGLRVESTDGSLLGRVDHLLATGAHDVLVLDGDGERLIPFVLDEIVTAVELEAGRIVVNWDASYWEK